jgi:hypothetical protein
MSPELMERCHPQILVVIVEVAVVVVVEDIVSVVNKILKSFCV